MISSPEKMTQIITSWAELRRQQLEWEGDEDRSRHVASVSLALGVKGSTPSAPVRTALLEPGGRRMRTATQAAYGESRS